MLSALCVSAVFLTAYLYYHGVIKHGRSTLFAEQTSHAHPPSWVGIVYNIVLWTHIPAGGYRRAAGFIHGVSGSARPIRPTQERRRWTLPIWLYVSDHRRRRLLDAVSALSFAVSAGYNTSEEENDMRAVCLAAGFVAVRRVAGPAAFGVRLPLLTGSDRRLRFGGRRRPAPRSSRLQPKHLPDGGDALSLARCGRLPDLPWSQAEGPGRTAGRAASLWRRRPLMFDPINRRRFVARSLQAGAVAALGDFTFLNGLPAPAADDKGPRANSFRSAPKSNRSSVSSRTRRARRSWRASPPRCARAPVTSSCSAPCSWPACAASNRVRSASSSTPYWSSTPLIWPACAPPDKERWLPLFWAIDNFKSSQARNKAEGDWRMAPVEESKLPAAAPGQAALH